MPGRRVVIVGVASTWGLELAQRLEALERRLAALEDAHRKPTRETEPKAEG
jgi:hypothetical protein